MTEGVLLSEGLDARLQESERRLKLAVRAADIGIWDWDLETNAMTYSERAKAIIGVAPDAPVTYEMVRDATHPDDFPWTSAQARRALDPQIRQRDPYEYRVVRLDTGEERWVIAHGEAIFVDTGSGPRAVRYLGTIQDITGRKAAEQALRESEARLSLAIEAAAMAVWEFDVRTDRVTASDELNRIFGFPPGATPTVDEIRACYLPGERERLRAAATEALARGDRRFELAFQVDRRDGARRWLLLRAEVVDGKDGAPQRAIGVVMDIDDARRAAEQQKLLAAELDHRVKNTLAVVQSVVARSFRGESVGRAAVDACLGRIRALGLANDVLLRTASAGTRLADLVDEITRPFRDAGDDRFEIHGGEALVSQDRSIPLAMALHELATNATKYGALSRDGGRVRLTWRPRDGGGVEIDWHELGGPPVVPPAHQGFGSQLLTGGLGGQLGRLDLAYEPDGVRCRITLIP